MKLLAKGDTAANITVILLLLFSAHPAFAGTLECADPPGGTITCESGQSHSLAQRGQESDIFIPVSEYMG